MIGLGKPDSPRYDGLLKMLEVLLSKRTVEEKKHILQEEFNFRMTENMIKESTDGRTEATFQATLANIPSLMYKVSWTAEQAMDALNIPQEERSQYLPKLKHLN